MQLLLHHFRDVSFKSNIRNGVFVIKIGLGLSFIWSQLGISGKGINWEYGNLGVLELAMQSFGVLDLLFYRLEVEQDFIYRIE